MYCNPEIYALFFWGFLNRLFIYLYIKNYYFVSFFFISHLLFFCVHTRNKFFSFFLGFVDVNYRVNFPSQNLYPLPFNFILYIYLLSFLLSYFFFFCLLCSFFFYFFLYIFFFFTCILLFIYILDNQAISLNFFKNILDNHFFIIF